jgi:hypothetical protein
MEEAGAGFHRAWRSRQLTGAGNDDPATAALVRSGSSQAAAALSIRLLGSTAATRHSGAA